MLHSVSATDVAIEVIERMVIKALHEMLPIFWERIWRCLSYKQILPLISYTDCANVDKVTILKCFYTLVLLYL